MSDENRQAHWDEVYTGNSENTVSWFQESPALSLELIKLAGATSASAIVDVGGGASRVVDGLIANGFERVTVLDLSEAALASAKKRLGPNARLIQWITADVTNWEPSEDYDILARSRSVSFSYRGRRSHRLHESAQNGTQIRRRLHHWNVCT